MGFEIVPYALLYIDATAGGVILQIVLGGTAGLLGHVPSSGVRVRHPADVV